MKTTINFSDFCDAFRDADRKENFSYEGKRILFDYLDEYESSTDEEIELDVIALCCEFNEDSVEDIIASYGIDVSEAVDDSEREVVRDYLNEHTCLVGETKDGFVYATF